jgi:hypothetical protein
MQNMPKITGTTEQVHKKPNYYTTGSSSGSWASPPNPIASVVQLVLPAEVFSGRRRGALLVQASLPKWPAGSGVVLHPSSTTPPARWSRTSMHYCRWLLCHIRDSSQFRRVSRLDPGSAGHTRPIMCPTSPWTSRPHSRRCPAAK